MKPIYLFAFLVMACSYAQETPVKVVFDVTSGDEAVHEATIRHVKYMAKAYPQSEFEVVLYSKSLDMVLKDKSAVAEDVIALAGKENVSFKICAGTMKRFEATEKDLLEGVEIVPDGIMEIIMKQQEGWGYIKEH